MHSTNYRNTFITVAPDSSAEEGRVPEKAGSVAELQWRMIHAAPYRHTSDDVVFGTYAARQGVPQEQLPAAREAFFSKGQPCLRSSPLVKTHGWGVHHDHDGRVAIFAVESPEYADFAEREDLTIVAGMRSKRQ